MRTHIDYGIYFNDDFCQIARMEDGMPVIKFSETMKEYCEARDANDEKVYKLVDVKDDYYKVLYDHLGHARIKALEYRRSDVQKAFDLKDQISDQEVEIKVLLKLRKDAIISKADLKTQLQEIYDRLNIDKVAKATDITKWYEVKNTKVNNRPAFKVVKML